MPSGPSERYDFFLSRRGSVAAVAREVADVLTEKGHNVLVQDYDIPLGASFVEAMHEAIINSRDLIILFTEDYLRSLTLLKIRFGAVEGRDKQERAASPTLRGSPPVLRLGVRRKCGDVGPCAPPP